MPRKKHTEKPTTSSQGSVTDWGETLHLYSSNLNFDHYQFGQSSENETPPQPFAPLTSLYDPLGTHTKIMSAATLTDSEALTLLETLDDLPGSIVLTNEGTPTSTVDATISELPLYPAEGQIKHATTAFGLVVPSTNPTLFTPPPTVRILEKKRDITARDGQAAHWKQIHCTKEDDVFVRLSSSTPNLQIDKLWKEKIEGTEYENYINAISHNKDVKLAWVYPIPFKEDLYDVVMKLTGKAKANHVETIKKRRTSDSFAEISRVPTTEPLLPKSSTKQSWTQAVSSPNSSFSQSPPGSSPETLTGKNLVQPAFFSKG